MDVLVDYVTKRVAKAFEERLYDMGMDLDILFHRMKKVEEGELVSMAFKERLSDVDMDLDILFHRMKKS